MPSLIKFNLKPTNLGRLSLLALVVLLTVGCGQTTESKPQGSISSEGGFSAPLPSSLTALYNCETELSAYLIIDGDIANRIKLTVDCGDGTVKGTVDGLTAESHEFLIQYFINDTTLVAEATATADIVAGDTPTVVDFTTINVDLDEDGISGTDEVDSGSDPNDPGSLPDTTAPNTTITDQPSNPSNSSSASFSFESTETGSTFECQIDGGGFSSCTSSESYTGLADGSHTFEIRATDAAGNTDPTAASYTWTIDTTAPTVDFRDPAVDAVDIALDTTVIVQFSEPMDTSTITISSFTLTQNPLISGSISFSAGDTVATFTPDSNLNGSTLYTATVTTDVQDLAGNPLAADETWTFTTQDIDPPTATVFFPPPTSLTDASDITVTGTATDDDTGVSAVRVNGILATSSDGFATWQAVVPLSQGTNNLVVETEDIPGNIDANAASVQIVRSTLLSSPLRTALDLANNRAFVVDISLDALVAVDLITGNRTIISDASTGTGTAFINPWDVIDGVINCKNMRAWS